LNFLFGWFVNFALSRNNALAMSIGCELIQAGAVPARKSAFICENENPAAQLMLDPPSALRRFCAVSVEKGS